MRNNSSLKKYSSQITVFSICSVHKNKTDVTVCTYTLEKILHKINTNLRNAFESFDRQRLQYVKKEQLIKVEIICWHRDVDFMENPADWFPIAANDLTVIADTVYGLL